MLAYVKLCIGAHCKDENDKKKAQNTYHNKKNVPWFTKTVYTKAFCTAYMQYGETRGLNHSPLKLLSIIQTWWGKLTFGLSAPERKVFFFVFLSGKSTEKQKILNLYLKEYFNQDCYCYSEMKPIDSMLSFNIHHYEGSYLCTNYGHLVHNPLKTFLSSRA